MPLLLYALRYRSPRTGKWIIARYRAEIHEIEREFGRVYELLDRGPRSRVANRSIRTATLASHERVPTTISS